MASARAASLVTRGGKIDGSRANGTAKQASATHDGVGGANGAEVLVAVPAAVGTVLVGTLLVGIVGAGIVAVGTAVVTERGRVVGGTRRIMRGTERRDAPSVVRGVGARAPTAKRNIVINTGSRAIVLLPR